ncbi:MAG: tRNA (adenosine(37)-N6)-threonylcarbamoyltransferase complex transferase subunit TsaD [Chlamydiae bacterium]|nr:tRNA (adenosine(37)-N6)-threonylcarbamoyltransferase complex transferase subunit TsaD [Chlamydiota bacterium]
MIVLGIESTCDETAASIVKDGHNILSNVIASQIELHKPYGGVFPELASRSHVNAITQVIDKAISEANIQKNDIDLISVAKGPGLIGSLLVGLNAAKGLSLAWNKPFVGVNHVEAHLYAAMMSQTYPMLPALGVVISGGHTFLVKINEVGTYTLLGTTIDDAIGEAFDKIAVMLGLPYPGGPAVEKLALQGDPSKHKFKAGCVKESPLNFSFSGLKTNVFYLLQGQNAPVNARKPLTEQEKADVAASFQQTAFRDLIKKCKIAISQHQFQAIYFGGGVSNNKTLRKMIADDLKDLPTFWPPFGLSLDNAAMIAGLGYHVFQRKNFISDEYDIEPETRIPLNR